MARGLPLFSLLAVALLAARVTGQVGRYELGVYQVSTGSTLLSSPSETDPEVAPREDFTVARLNLSQHGAQ